MVNKIERLLVIEEDNTYSRSITICGFPSVAIGRRCLFTVSTGVILGMGTTLDVFQTDGNFCSSYELFRI